jgi:hypothetical protein
MLPRPPSPPTDPASVAFVVRCFLIQVVAVEELREWAEQVIASGEECPIFVEGLAEFDGVGEEIYHMLGFVPDRAFTREADAALAGIAHSRGRVPQPGNPGEAEARQALQSHPELADEFRLAFKFLRWDGVAADS